MRKKLLLITSIMIITVILLFAVIFIKNKTINNSSENDEKDIKIVTSFYPVYVLTLNLTDQIGGLKVDSLTDFSGGCLHDYQLTTNDMKLLSDADVFIINGGGMEEYIDDVIKNYPDLTVINLTNDVPMLTSLEHEGEDNPHVWLDPELYIMQIENARKGLTEYIGYLADERNIDKDNIIEKINVNTDSYMSKVKDISHELNGLLNKVKDMAENKNISNKVVIFHDSFAYLANKAGLEVAYNLEMDDDTPLSAGEIAEVISFIKNENIRYLFTEEQYEDTISDRIKEETEAEIYIIDSAVTGDADKDSYITAMKNNISTLRKAFEDND